MSENMVRSATGWRRASEQEPPPPKPKRRPAKRAAKATVDEVLAAVDAVNAPGPEAA